MTTDEQIARMRANLKGPSELWAALQEDFLAKEPGLRLDRSEGLPEWDRVRWILRDADGAIAWQGRANTRSEARALYKKQFGEKIPAGARFERAP